MARTIKAIRKILITIAGFTVLILGVILIPAPGPGLLVIIAGLLILSTEFEWAKSYLHRARMQLDSVRQKMKLEKPKKTSAKNVDRPGDHKRQGKSRD